MFPENVQRLGPALPPGWQRPTRGLILGVLDQQAKGIAPPSAAHLYRAAQPVTEEKLQDEQVQYGIELLKGHCRREGPGALSAAGMAYPQLAVASQDSLRILALNMNMPDIRRESLDQAQVGVFFNPVVKPIEDEGWQWRRESCFSAPGIAVVVRRWNAIMVEEWGQESYRLDGTTAWIMQHEADHLDGVICVTHAISEGRKLYFLPPEAQEAALDFFADLSRGEPSGDWPELAVEQWIALTTGSFAYEYYAPYVM